MKPSVYGFIPEDNLIDLPFSCKLVVDPDNNYFNSQIKIDRESHLKMILVHGCEPKVVNNITDEIIKNHAYFDKIFTYDVEVLKNTSNSELFCFGSCWVLSGKVGETIMTEKEFIEKEFNKKFKVSFIKSHKNYLEGHKMRQYVPELMLNRNFESLNLSNIPIKFPLFEDSMFHIAIENCRETNYFSEKIVDCFMSKTVPIYCGCPNIGDYFDINGIIIFNNLNELHSILSKLTVDDYINRIDILGENYNISKNYAFFFQRINNLLLII